MEAQEAVESSKTLVAYAESKGFKIDQDEAEGLLKAGDEIAQRASAGLSEAELNPVVGGNAADALAIGGMMGGYGAMMGAVVGGPIGAAVGGSIGGVIGLFGDGPGGRRGRKRHV